MRIGELAKSSGLSRDTIRFYERKELLSKGSKLNKFNTYKDYSETAVICLHEIKHLKDLGFTLAEIKDLQELINDREATCPAIKERIESKVLIMEKQIQELTRIKTQLLEGMRKCHSEADSFQSDAICPILLPAMGK